MTGFEIQQNARIKDYLNLNKQQSNNSPQPLDALLKKNSHTLVVMSPEEFWDFMKRYYQRKGYSEEDTIQLALQQLIKKGLITEAAKHEWEDKREMIKSAGGFIPSFLDSKALTILASEMKRGGNLFSKFRIQHYAGASYIILKGNPALRTHLTGTRYLANNPKVVSMGLGKAGAGNAIRSGGIVTVIFSLFFHGMDQLMDDKLTWHHFVGGLATDVVIAAAAAGISWAAVIGAAALGLTVGPLAAVLIVGTLTSIGLSNLFGDKLTKLFADNLKAIESSFRIINPSFKTLKKIGGVYFKAHLNESLLRLSKDIAQIKHEINQTSRLGANNPDGMLHKIFSIPDMRSF